MTREQGSTAPFDPVTGLRTEGHLVEDLGELTDQAPGDDGSALLASFEVQGLDRYAQRCGSGKADDLLRVLARRLTSAVRGSGLAYRLDADRFAVLARVGRGGSSSIVLGASAALRDRQAGVTSRVARTIMPVELIEPAEAVRLLRCRSPVELGARSPSAPGAARAAGSTSVPVAVGGHRSEREDGASIRRHPAMVSSGRSLPETTAPEADLPVAAPSLAQARRAPAARPPSRLPYLRVVTRFRVTVLCGVVWMGLSAWLAQPWIAELGRSISLPLAYVVVGGIALLPGYLNVQLVTSLLLDRPSPLRLDLAYPALTLLVAAYNEEATIAQTIAYALAQDYPGPMSVLVIDDGSSDDTRAVAGGFADVDDRVTVLAVRHGGKAAALNAGLSSCETPLAATIDADTLLMPGALRRAVARMLTAPPDTVAVAGSVLVRNSRAGLIARAQVWDYFLGIGSIKRQQALLQSTLVAQGAFSVYDARAVREAGGWPDCIGEDIVMTWALLDRGGRTTFEPTAVAFTEAPVTLRHLARQRRRWARGMIEGLRQYGIALVRRRTIYTHGVIADAVFPYLDLAFTCAFLPGIALAAAGNFAIVGPMTLAVLPINALMASIMYRRQKRSLCEAGLNVRHELLGFVFFLLVYQLFMSPVSVSGYVEEMFHVGRRW